MSSTQDIARFGDGTAIDGTPFTEVVPAATLGGALVVLSAEMPVGLRVPEHQHDDADQVCVVISGRVGTSVDGVEHLAEAGGVLVVPRGCVHAHWNAGDVPAQVLEIYTPPGMEDVFRAAGAGIPVSG